LLKQTHQWSSDLENYRKNIEDNDRAKESEEGFGYIQYLQLLLFLMQKETIVYRCMDLIECNEGVQMDMMVQSVKCNLRYEGKPLFWNLNFLKVQQWDVFEFVVPVRLYYTGA